MTSNPLLSSCMCGLAKLAASWAWLVVAQNNISLMDVQKPELGLKIEKMQLVGSGMHVNQYWTN